MNTEKLMRKLDVAMEQLESIRKELSQSSPKLPASIASEERQHICHFCKEPLGEEKGIRGVHIKCNQRMTRAKKDGEVTDAELMEQGKIGPPKKSGRKKMSLDDYATQQAANTESDEAALPLRKKQSRKGDAK